MFRRFAALAVGVITASIVVASWPAAPLSEEQPAPPLPAAARSARLVVAADALWAGHAASGTVTKLALPDGQRVWQTAVGCEPGTLAGSDTRVYAACVDTGEVVALDASSGAIVRRSRIGHGVFGLLLAGGRLYATLEHDDAIVALRPDALTIEARAATGREPRGIALRAGRLYVVSYVDASIRRYEVPGLRPAGGGSVGERSVFAESLTPSASMDRLYVPHQRQMTANLARKFDNTIFPLVTALDLASLEPIRREELALDAVDTPVSLPIASVIDAAGARLYVANAISSDVSVIDLASGFRVGHVLVGDHPRDLALSPDGTLLYTLNAVSDDVSAVDTTTLKVLRSFPLAADPRSAVVQKGERLFMQDDPTTASHRSQYRLASKDPVARRLTASRAARGPCPRAAARGGTPQDRRALGRSDGSSCRGDRRRCSVGGAEAPGCPIPAPPSVGDALGCGGAEQAAATNATTYVVRTSRSVFARPSCRYGAVSQSSRSGGVLYAGPCFSASLPFPSGLSYVGSPVPTSRSCRSVMSAPEWHSAHPALPNTAAPRTASRTACRRYARGSRSA